jgi:hypothetical protein
MALACFGLANRAEANKGGCHPRGARCNQHRQCCSSNCNCAYYGRYGICC